jgi:hypothetical protein
MDLSKDKLKPIVSDAIFNHTKLGSPYRPKSLSQLRLLLAQYLKQVDGNGNTRLNPETRGVVDEIFWDLFREGEITISSETETDHSMENFKPHSEAKTKLVEGN